MEQVQIGKFIASLRKEKKYTQEQLAERLGVNNRTISRWENGHCMPDLSLLHFIAKELDVSISELLNGKRMSQEELLVLREHIDLILNISREEKNMKTKKMNHYFISGAACLLIIFLNQQFHILSYIFQPNFSDFVAGALTSLVIVFELVGIYNNNHDTTLRDKKMKIIYGKK